MADVIELWPDGAGEWSVEAPRPETAWDIVLTALGTLTLDRRARLAQHAQRLLDEQSSTPPRIQ